MESPGAPGSESCSFQVMITLPRMTLPLRDLEGVHNFRTLGPYPLPGGARIRQGMIYRSGALELMTPVDCAWLGETAGIATILDLRHPEELMASEGEHALWNRVRPLSIFPEARPLADLIGELNGLHGLGPTPSRYLEYLSVGGDRLARGFEVFASEANYPVLVHCTAGKDRTGVLLGLVMDVLGADHADIATEYGLSDASIPRLIAYLRASGRELEGSEAEIYRRLSTPPDRMAGFLELLTTKYGNAEAFFLDHGVSPDTIANVRRLLTEE